MTTTVTITTTIWPIRLIIATAGPGGAIDNREETIAPHQDVTRYVSSGQLVTLSELPVPDPS